MIDLVYAMGAGGSGTQGAQGGGLLALLPLLLIIVLVYIAAYRAGKKSASKDAQENTIGKTCIECGITYSKGEMFCIKCGNALE